MFYFHPCLGKIPILTNIFQMAWNHQPEKSWWIRDPFIRFARHRIPWIWTLRTKFAKQIFWPVCKAASKHFQTCSTLQLKPIKPQPRKILMMKWWSSSWIGYVHYLPSAGIFIYNPVDSKWLKLWDFNAHSSNYIARLPDLSLKNPSFNSRWVEGRLVFPIPSMGRTVYLPTWMAVF